MAEQLAKGTRQSVLDIVRKIARESDGDSVTVDAFSKGLGRRSYGLLLVTLNLPNLIPLPLPILSILFGLPLAFVGVQLFLGLERPWIPSFLLMRGVNKSSLLHVCDKVDDRYGWVHRLLRPRLTVLTQGVFVRLIGLAIFIMACVMVLPIPLGNLVLAIPIALLSLGLLERDGAFVIAGIVFGVAGILFNLLIGASVMYGLFLAMRELLGA